MHSTYQDESEELPNGRSDLSLPDLIDQIAAHTPDRVFISLPVTHNPADGYHDYTFQDLANAINRCAWWIDATIAIDSETLAYIGSQDFRCTIMIVAAIKTGHRIQGFYPALTRDSYVHLLQASRCKALLCSEPILPVAQQVLSSIDITHYPVPELETWLNTSPVAHFAYDLPASASADPLAIVHTSGSIGPPKPVPLAHGWWASQKASFRHANSDDLMYARLRGLRVLNVLPLTIAAGIITVLTLNIVYDFVIVLPPPWTITITPSSFNACLDHADAQAAIIATRFCRPIANTPQYLDNVSRLKYLIYIGAPCPTDAGTILATRTHLTQIYGNTESGAHPMYLMAAEDWAYVRFHPNFPYAFRHVCQDLYELVIVRNDTDMGHTFQSAFRVFPEMKEYNLRDLFSPHASKEGAWRYRGRAEDLTRTGNGELFVPREMEVMIESYAPVTGAIVYSHSMAGLGLIVELTVGCMSDGASKHRIMEELWALVEKANEICPVQAKMERDMIIYTEDTYQKGMPRGIKGYPVRTQVIEKFTGRTTDQTEYNSYVKALKSHL